MYYTECPECGAALDPGEKCDCQEERNEEDMSRNRGFAIAAAAKNAAFEIHLRKLAEQKERRSAHRTARQKKEACTGGAVQTSNVGKNTLSNYTANEEACQV